MRKNATEAERKLWFELRGFKHFGHYFRRQVPIGRYIVDFACLKARLIVELDGSHHGEGRQLAHDRIRDDWLKAQGFHILRFWNRDVFTHKQDVLNAITVALPPMGGGGRPVADGVDGGGVSRQKIEKDK